MATETSILPTVNMLCTVCHPSNRYAASITRVDASARTVWVTLDHTSRERKFTRRKDGSYVAVGARSPSLILGVAENYTSPES